ncbi:lipoprotein-releasing ABC transporter ATP-binding protein LolD [Halioxenophilus sp. WMMB6]|uniref:lipoprotein-releasing ABC transporter ATP-binding protein LolD n=1 Tax=Halioxenophilus sp. WMMB6 TaxID=3073815 RepID=UPI00295EF55E|nr:lipoprotein-releasing ABC transporter ATP-binding protein LolD [Halioxenophilus sp. WMMB6]
MTATFHSSDAVLRCKDLVKIYKQGPLEVRVLDGVNLTIAAGETVAIVGASGAGKSTLLNLLGGLDLPTSGEVFLQGKALTKLNERERGRLRNQFMGFVYQFHHLLPEFSALENVMMPLFIGKVGRSEAKQRALAILEQVGLAARVGHKPAELSGGERQRVAIARALVTNPSCVFMDEPTGNLDTRTAQSVQALMMSLNEQLSTSFVIVTHDEHLAQSMDRTLYLSDGRLNSQLSVEP